MAMVQRQNMVMVDLFLPILTLISATDASQACKAFLKAIIFTVLTGGLSPDKFQGTIHLNHLQSLQCLFAHTGDNTWVCFPTSP